MMQDVFSISVPIGVIIDEAGISCGLCDYLIIPTDCAKPSTVFPDKCDGCGVSFVD